MASLKTISVTAALLSLVIGAGSLPVHAQNAEQPKPAAETAQPFGFDAVYLKALQLAEQPYQPDRPPLPPVFRDMQYDQYRDIRFRPAQNLWRGESRFQLQFFSRGFLYADRVIVNVINGGKAQPVAFSREFFDFGKNQIPDRPFDNMGFAGFRVLYPLHDEDRLDEVGVFLGASYFRAIGQNQAYGVSARGLAIDTGLSAPEEFPVFREFWIEKPGRDARHLVVYALLDSESATGAYRFRIEPGLATVMDVQARIKFRSSVEKVGIAPLTSMFYHGENTDRFMDDFRPEVHDSDGLLIETAGGERIWRPAQNPERLLISTFEANDLRGFGLMQRDRQFAHYQDTEAVYHTRPSVWVEAVAPWGKGNVELVEIPSNSERNDNLVAFWRPAAPPRPDIPLNFEYRLHYSLNPEAQLQGGKTVSTRIGAGGTDVPDHSRRKFVLDFASPVLERLEPDDPTVQAVCNTSSGDITPPVAHHNRFSGGWRLFFELIPESGKPADLRCFLRRGTDVLSETWVYRWVPN